MAEQGPTGAVGAQPSQNVAVRRSIELPPPLDPPDPPDPPEPPGPLDPLDPHAAAETAIAPDSRRLAVIEGARTWQTLAPGYIRAAIDGCER